MIRFVSDELAGLAVEDDIDCPVLRAQGYCKEAAVRCRRQHVANRRQRARGEGDHRHCHESTGPARSSVAQLP